jgi:hypothetical protein
MSLIQRRSFISLAGAAAVLPAFGASSGGFRFAVIADPHIIDEYYKGPENSPEDTESILHSTERLTSARNVLNSLQPAC